MKKRRLDSLLFLCYNPRMDKNNLPPEYVLKYLGLPVIGKTDISIHRLLEKLKKLEVAINDANRINEDDTIGDALDAISDIDWFQSSLQDAVKIVEEFEGVEVEADRLVSDMIYYMDDETAEDIMQQYLIDKLKGETK